MRRMLLAFIIPIGITIGAAAPTAHPAPRPASPTMIFVHCDVRTGFCDDRPHPGPRPAIRQVRV